MTLTDDRFSAAVLNLYLQLPETPSRVYPYDRKRAIDLENQHIPLAVIESAFLLASLRRLVRSPDNPPLNPIRSLSYFDPVIQEVLANPLSEDYVQYLRRKVAALSSR